MRVVILAGRLSRERNPIVFQLAEGLSYRGFTVELITGYPSRGLNEQQIQYYQSNCEHYVNENFMIRRVGSRRRETGSLFIRALDYLTVTFSIYRAALKSTPDVYMIYSSPPFLMLAARRLRQRAGVIITVQDLFPGSLLSILGTMSRKILQSPLHFIMGKAYRSATKIVTISEDMKDSIVSYGVFQHTVSVAPNWANTSDVYYVPPLDNPLFKEYNLDYKAKYIVYAGNIGRFQAVDKILELAEASKETGKGFGFLIFGDGDRKKYIESLVLERQLTNVKVLPLQAPNKVKFVYSIGVFNVLSLSPEIVNYAHPSKTAYLLATGVPILGVLEKTSRLAQFIIDNNLGCVISNSKERSDSFKSELDYLIKYLNKLDCVPLENSREIMEERYSLNNSLGIYSAAINECKK
ncbi:MAG: glycosyltransferase family 4 protein [Pseudomonas sp.]|nr:glycosyltransferase family 4 protein [Pseudomonas sp.]